MFSRSRLHLSAAVVLTNMSTIGITSRASAQEIVFPGQAWEHATPQSQGINPERLELAIKHLNEVCGEDGTRRTLIVRNGYVIWAGNDVEEKDAIWSCTKSFMSTCFGLLWDDGKVAPEDLALKFDPAMKAQYPTVTLEHLATFTSGYEGDDDGLTPKAPQYAPGTAFHYSSQSNKLAEVLTIAGGKPLEVLFADRIGGPIGITDKDMSWGVVGKHDGMTINGGSGGLPGSVAINAVGIARFGWLFANDGVWDGKRLISEKYIDYATVSRTSTETPPFDPHSFYTQLPGNYGFNWWTNGMRPDGKRNWPSAPDRTFAAQGNKNNNCLIVPEWKLVIVRLGEDKIIDMFQYDVVFKLLDPTKQSEPLP